MTWSYSRVKCFLDCPYRFYLKYILDRQGKELFFSNYGKFVHSLLEKYYSGELLAARLPIEYLAGFDDNVLGNAPNRKIFNSYFDDGLKYFRDFSPLKMETVAVEQRVDVDIEGIRFVGVIDLVGKDDTGIVVVDNKSRKLKQPSGREKPTQNDLLLDDYFIQLYLYSVLIEQKYGKKPSFLALNCFRNREFIKVPFDDEKCVSAKRFLTKNVEKIEKETEFDPNFEYFKCHYLCDMSDHCEYCRLM